MLSQSSRLRLMRICLLILFVLLPYTAWALPTITEVKCSVDYHLRDGSSSRGVLAGRYCLLRVGFVPYSSAIMRFSPEKIFGCFLEEGQVECEFSEEEIANLNSQIDIFGRPRFLGTLFTDRTVSEIQYGCVQESYANHNHSPYVYPTPAQDTGYHVGTLCRENSLCSLQVDYEFACMSLPSIADDGEGNDPGTPSCETQYRRCAAKNLGLQIAVGLCQQSLTLRSSKSNFPKGETECVSHLQSCNLSNLQLQHAYDACRE